MLYLELTDNDRIPGVFLPGVDFSKIPRVFVVYAHKFLVSKNEETILELQDYLERLSQETLYNIVAYGMTSNIIQAAISLLATQVLLQEYNILEITSEIKKINPVYNELTLLETILLLLGNKPVPVILNSLISYVVNNAPEFTEWLFTKFPRAHLLVEAARTPDALVRLYQYFFENHNSSSLNMYLVEYVVTERSLPYITRVVRDLNLDWSSLLGSTTNKDLLVVINERV